MNRRINRHKYDLDELGAHLADEDSLAARIYRGYRKLLAARQIPAFHPDAPIKILDGVPDSVLAFTRVSLDSQQQVFVAANFGIKNITLKLDEIMAVPNGTTFKDLILHTSCQECLLPAGGFSWLSAEVSQPN